MSTYILIQHFDFYKFLGRNNSTVRAWNGRTLTSVHVRGFQKLKKVKRHVAPRTRKSKHHLQSVRGQCSLELGYFQSGSGFTVC